MPDVMDWTYTGNKLHPTQKSIHIPKPLIDTLTRRLRLDMRCSEAHRAAVYRHRA
jgi:hypothetical protein